MHVRDGFSSIWDKAYSRGRETLEIAVFEKVTAGQCRKGERRKGKGSNKVEGIFRTQLVTCGFKRRELGGKTFCLRCMLYR